MIKRIRTAREQQQQPPMEEVRIDDQLEVMTPTQAGRFQELQRLHALEREPAGGPETMPHYSLPEASRRFGVPVNRLLQLAASGKLACLLPAAGLRGTWNAAATGRKPLPEYLVLPRKACGELETWGSAYVLELEHPEAPRLRLRLHEPLWVEPAKIVLEDPVPGRHTT